MNFNCPRCNKDMICGKFNEFIAYECSLCEILTLYEDLSFYALYNYPYRFSNKGFIKKLNYPKEIFDFNLEVCSAKQAYDILNKYIENKIFE